MTCTWQRAFTSAAFLVFLAGCGGGGGGTASNPQLPGPSATPSAAASVSPAPSPSASAAAIAVVTPAPLAGPTFNPGMTGAINFNVVNVPTGTVTAQVIVSPLQGNGTASQSSGLACTPQSCFLTVAAPVGFDGFTLVMQNASGTTLSFGSLRTPILTKFVPTIGISMNGTPTSIALSLDQKNPRAGTNSTLTFSLVLKDSNKNRVIGNLPLATPITMSGNDGGSTVQFASRTFTTPGTIVSGTYMGSVSPAIKFTFASGTTGMSPIRHPQSNDGSTALIPEAANQIVTINGQAQDTGGLAFDNDEEDIEEADVDAQQPLDVYRRPLAALPASIDLSPNFPPVGNQGTQGSCASYSAGYAMMSYLYKVKNNWSYVLSGGGPDYTHIMSPAFMYNLTNGGKADAGGNMQQLSEFLATKGISTWQSLPYLTTDWVTQPSSAAVKEALQYQIAGFKMVNGGDITTAKTVLANGSPIYWGIPIDAGFQALGGNKAIWSGPLGTSLGGHAMVIVGYDDALQAFKILNSWDVTWASNGYGYISYSFWAAIPDTENFYFIPK